MKTKGREVKGQTVKRNLGGGNWGTFRNQTVLVTSETPGQYVYGEWKGKEVGAFSMLDRDWHVLSDLEVAK